MLTEFGALIVFWGVLYFAGIKPAIAATVAFIAVDGCYRWWRKLPVTRLYILTSALAIGFGCIDLMVATPFMIKFEAVIVNIALGIFFVAGARGEKSLIQEVAEKRLRIPEPRRRALFLPGADAGLGRVFLRQGSRLSLDRSDPAAGTGARAAHRGRRREPRLHVRDQSRRTARCSRSAAGSACCRWSRNRHCRPSGSLRPTVPESSALDHRRHAEPVQQRLIAVAAGLGVVSSFGP